MACGRALRRPLQHDNEDAAKKRREEMWMARRTERAEIQASGLDKIWGHSPRQIDIQETYKLRVAAEEIQAEHAKKGEKLKEDSRRARKLEMRAVRNVSEDDLSACSEAKKSKKDKENDKKKRKGSMSPTPILLEHLRDQGGASEIEKPGSYSKDLLMGERIRRRGEIGLSSGEIAEYEKVGYVMSGSRYKAMEATKLRKENQILTAEEKRLLIGVSMEAKKKKEEAVLEQFRSFIRNKNMRC